MHFFAPTVQVSNEDGKDVFDERSRRMRHLNYHAEILILDDEGPFEVKGFVLNPNEHDEPGYCCSMSHHDLENTLQ